MHSSPNIEVITSDSDPVHLGAQPAWPQPQRQSHRLLIFLSVLIMASLLSLSYVYLRPPIYGSAATLLTLVDTPQSLSHNDSNANKTSATPTNSVNTQANIIQQQLLTDEKLLTESLQRLHALGIEALAQLRLADLTHILSIAPIADTNLVELRAEGENPDILPLMINTWIDVYLEARDQQAKSGSATDQSLLQERIATLESKIAAKRNEIQSFREQHGIISSGREENRVTAQLQGLNNTLNNATEEAVKAKARLNAIKQSIARGEPVVPKTDQRSLASLQQRAQQLRERMTELERQYTRNYINVTPSLRVIPEQLKDLEHKIQDMVAYGQNSVLAEAEQDELATRQAVQAIESKIERIKQQASEFSARFAQFEALQQELTEMEALYRDAKQQLVQVEIVPVEKYPPVKVISRASRPLDPIRPDYTRDALIAISGSLLLALFAVWLTTYLAQPVATTPAFNISTISLSRGEALPANNTLAITPPTSRQTPALAFATPGFLADQPLNDLFHASSNTTRSFIALLLSGLSVTEILNLNTSQIDNANYCLHVGGNHPRTLPLTSMVIDLLNATPWLENNASGSLTEDDINAMLRCSAIDADFDLSEAAVADSIRNSYIVYLVRQGIRLNELSAILGPISPTLLAAFGRFSPPGKGKSMMEIERVHPLLRAIAISLSGPTPAAEE